MIIALPVLILLLGLVLYFVTPAGSKPGEVGRMMFFCGLLVALLLVGGSRGVKFW